MVGVIGRLFSQFSFLKAIIGDVLFETPAIRGRTGGSISWRLKRDADGRCYLGAKLNPDYAYGPEGGMTSFVNLDLQSVEQLKADLDVALVRLRQLDASQNVPDSEALAKEYPGPWTSPAPKGPRD
ncbi:hypothetical protein [Bosea sp. BIWAKO-01]|uniref:hypothetical protein n=1 Tax=Bosea sp. BIWAKO-01 TaxID=506668 RepID=UPI0008529909|nr:hypothetical protein [Bosea sp. BIWAKO-01]